MRALDWEARLDAVVSGRLRVPFRWGEHDCVSFAAACVQAVLGDRQAAPLLEGWLSTYADEGSAAALAESLGGIPTAVRARLGEPLDSVLRARRGDLLLAGPPAIAIGPALGVCTGAYGAFAARCGLMHLALDRCSQAWRVG